MKIEFYHIEVLHLPCWAIFLRNKFNDKIFLEIHREVHCGLCCSMRREGVLRRKCL